MTVRRSIENLTARLALYEAHSQRVEGCFVHTHAGHRTEVTRLLPERGGKLTVCRQNLLDKLAIDLREDLVHLG